MKSKWLGMLVAVLSLSALAGADILHGIPGGDATILPDEINTTVNDQYGSPAGWWSSYHGWTNAGATVATGSGADRHIEIAAGWLNDDASAWYVDYGSTPAAQAWKISADLKWTGGTTNTLYFSLYADESGSASAMGLSITGTSIGWSAGSASGTFTSATGLTSSYQTVAFEYDPVSGAATCVLGSEVIFDVTTDAGLSAKRVNFANHMPDNYDTSALWVDNISAVEVPEPATMSLLLIGGVSVLIRRKTK